MITVTTALDIQNVGTEHRTNKYVMVAMDAGDAFAIATILMNSQAEISEDWESAVNRLSLELIKAGNVCK